MSLCTPSKGHSRQRDIALPPPQGETAHTRSAQRSARPPPARSTAARQCCCTACPQLLRADALQRRPVRRAAGSPRPQPRMRGCTTTPDPVAGCGPRPAAVVQGFAQTADSPRARRALIRLCQRTGPGGGLSPVDAGAADRPCVADTTVPGKLATAGNQVARDPRARNPTP